MRGDGPPLHRDAGGRALCERARPSLDGCGLRGFRRRGRRGGECGGHGDQNGGRGDAGTPRRWTVLHDRHHPFFDRALSERAGKWSNWSVFDVAGLEQHASVRRALPRQKVPGNPGVAAQLDVAVDNDVHDPHQRVEPVRAYGEYQDQLPQRVEAHDVGVFVGEHQVGRAGIAPVERRGHQDYGMQDAVG